jgi:hypothetical protein
VSTSSDPESTSERIDQYVAEVLAKAPPLTAAQRSQLAELLRGVRQDTGLAEELKAKRAAIEQRGKR